MSGKIVWETKDQVATLTMSNVAKKNAISLAMWQELSCHLDMIKKNNAIRVVVIKGEQDHFSSGADIAEFSGLRLGEAKKMYDQTIETAYNKLHSLLIPTAAYIKGYCFGGGFGLAMQCDFRFSEPDAVFSLPVAKRGLSYPKEQIQQLIHIVGLTNAKDILLTARQISAKEAEQMGFTSIINNPLKKDLDSYVTMIKETAPLSVQAVKAGFLELTGSDSGFGMPDYSELAERCSDSEDYLEATAAFAEKRKPRFRGI